MAGKADFGRLGRPPAARGGARASSGLCASASGHDLPRDGPRRHGRVDSGTGSSGLCCEAVTAREAPGEGAR